MHFRILNYMDTMERWCVQCREPTWYSCFSSHRLHRFVEIFHSVTATIHVPTRMHRIPCTFHLPAELCIGVAWLWHNICVWIPLPQLNIHPKSHFLTTTLTIFLLSLSILLSPSLSVTLFSTHKQILMQLYSNCALYPVLGIIWSGKQKPTHNNNRHTSILLSISIVVWFGSGSSSSQRMFGFEFHIVKLFYALKLYGLRFAYRVTTQAIYIYVLLLDV